MRADKFNVGAGGVEMAVAGDNVTRFQARAGEYPLGGAALMGGENMLEAGNLAHAVFKFMP
jgi:hypothetical protein